MKIADELRRLSRRNPMTIFYESLLRDLRLEAQEGGNHRVVTFAKSNYNPIVNKLLKDGFKVIINNYDENKYQNI